MRLWPMLVSHFSSHFSSYSLGCYKPAHQTDAEESVAIYIHIIFEMLEAVTVLKIW